VRCAGRKDDAIVRLCALTLTRPSDLVVKELLFDAFFSREEAVALSRYGSMSASPRKRPLRRSRSPEVGSGS
jgi:hypothetical protein